MVTTDKPLPATLAPDRRETAALGLPPCVFCGRSMIPYLGWVFR